MSDLSIKKFYPVIHCVDPYEQQGIGHALANTRIAIENGADGVFLIGHGMHFSDLVYIYENVRKQFPEIWIGINFLDISHEKNWAGLSTIVNKCYKLNALWIDDMPSEKLDTTSTVQIFGGVAFKYINPNIEGESLVSACNQAVNIVNIATTSGDRTGSAPNIVKLKLIKEILKGRIPLALASGVNSINVSNFLNDVDIFLVASSICERRHDLGNHEYLVPLKVHELAQIIHA